MYTVSVQKSITAFHFLPDCDDAQERERHTHAYRVTAQFAGHVLDRNGYLIDIREAERALERVLKRFHNRTLNELREFEGLNPSIEHFARIVCEKLRAAVNAPGVHAVTVILAESADASASFRGLYDAYRADHS